MKNYKVYIYGAGNEYRKLSAYLEKQGSKIEIQAIVTTSPQEFDVLDGYPVIRPKEIDLTHLDYVIIAVCNAWEEIAQMLLAQGIEKEKIIRSYLFYIPWFSIEGYSRADMSESIEWTKDKNFVEQMTTITEGYAVAKSIVSQYGEDTHFIALKGHIGDAAVSCSVVKAYKTYHNDGQMYCQGTDCEKSRVKKVVVITNELLAGVARLYEDIDEIIILPDKCLSNLWAYTVSSLKREKNLYAGYPDSFSWERLKVLNVSWQHWLMCVPLGIEGGRARRTEKSRQAEEQVIDSYNILPENTVILCPYAKTTSILSLDAWDGIVKEYQRRGYRVFTNVGPQEMELEGTERLQIPIDALVGIVDAGCMVVGVQSGIIDVLKYAVIKKKMYVVLNAKTKTDKMWFTWCGNMNTIPGVKHFLFENESEEMVMEALKNELFA